MPRSYVKRSGSHYVYERQYSTKKGKKTYKQRIPRVAATDYTRKKRGPKPK